MRRPALILTAAVAVSAILLVTGHGVGLLAALPAMLLVATVACGRFVGEETLSRLRRRVQRRQRRFAAARTIRPTRPHRSSRTRPVLLASGRGVRGPPAPDAMIA